MLTSGLGEGHALGRQASVQQLSGVGRGQPAVRAHGVPGRAPQRPHPPGLGHTELSIQEERWSGGEAASLDKAWWSSVVPLEWQGGRVSVPESEMVGGKVKVSRGAPRGTTVQELGLHPRPQGASPGRCLRHQASPWCAQQAPAGSEEPTVRVFRSFASQLLDRLY